LKRLRIVKFCISQPMTTLALKEYTNTAIETSTLY